LNKKMGELSGCGNSGKFRNEPPRKWWLFRALLLVKERLYGNPHHRNRVTCLPRASVNVVPLRSPSRSGEARLRVFFVCLSALGRLLPSVLFEFWVWMPKTKPPPLREGDRSGASFKAFCFETREAVAVVGVTVSPLFRPCI